LNYVVNGTKPKVDKEPRLIRELLLRGQIEGEEEKAQQQVEAI